MSARINKKRLGGAAAILSLLFLIAGVTTQVVKNEPPEAGATPSSPDDVTLVVAGAGCDKVGVATLALVGRGFTPDQFVIGEDQINWDSPEAHERGRASFVSDTPTNAKAVTAELSSDSDQSKAALGVILEQSKAPREQVLNPSNWVPAQFKVATSLEGNTMFKDGQAKPAGTRQSAAGDVTWLFVNPTECPRVMSGEVPPVLAVVAHRAGCGNPQTALPKPGQGVTPTPAPPAATKPPAHSAKKPSHGPTPTTRPPTPTTVPQGGGKDHRKSPVSPDRNHPDERVRPVIPAPPVVIRKPDAPQPATQPAPSNPPGRGDSGSGATNTTVPPTTVAPPPAPPTTAPPATNPPPPPPGGF